MTEEIHDFRRERSCKNCSICFDLWPSVEGVVSKFHVCSKCTLGVHSNCIEIGKVAYPCNNQKVNQIILSNKLNSCDIDGYTILNILINHR